MARSRAATPRAFDPLGTPPRVLLANFYPFQKAEVAAERYSRSNLFLPATQGVGTMRVGPQTFTLRQGQVLHVPWAAPVRYEADRQDPFVVIGVHLAYAPWDTEPLPPPLHASRGVSLDQAQMEKPPGPQPFDHPFILEPSPTSTLLETAVELARTWESRGLRNRKADLEARIRALAMVFLMEFRSCCQGKLEQPPHPQAAVVRELISWLEMRFSVKFPRAELADRAGISESSLTSAFRAVTGKAPIDYLIDMRLAHARRLLATSHARVGEIARQVGIPDVYYFSKLFKSRNGQSPLHYRKRRRL